MADKIKINILNRDYYVDTTKYDALHLSALARYVEDKMKEAGEKNNIVETSRLAVHAALNIAQDYFTLKDKLTKLNPELYNRKIEGLIETIEETLTLE